MGVAAVRADADDRRAVGGQAVGPEVVEDRPLDLGLHRRPARADPVGDQLEGDVVGLAADPGGLLVHGPLVVVPDRFELLDQVAGRDHLDPRGPDELDRAGVDPGDVGVGVPGGIFHRQPAPARDQRGDLGLELGPAEVDALRARQVVEGAGLDLMDELDRLARGGDEVEEPAGAGLLALQVEDPPGQGVAAVEVVEQPAVEALFAEGILDRGEVEHRAGSPERGVGARIPARKPSRSPILAPGGPVGNP